MKTLTIPIVIAAVLIGGAIVLAGVRKDSIGTTPESVSNVNVIDGKQIIAINAKGGYSPKVTAAKAEMPTIIKVDTRGTFDCSAALSIPNLGYRNNLPMSGETLIDVPPQKSGSVLQGLCAMGMYSFQVKFN